MERNATLLKWANGFTLIELLVVIGIISALAAILMPSLEQSLASARSVYCMNNLKQIGVSTHLYTNDNRGWVIPLCAFRLTITLLYCTLHVLVFYRITLLLGGSMLTIREELCAYGRKIADKGLVAGAGGNISAREGRLIWMKLSGFAMDDFNYVSG